MTRTWTEGAAALVLLGLIAVQCGRVEAPGRDAEETAAPNVPAASVATADIKTVADLFPAGSGRELVLNNCGSCHNLACSVIGQRTGERWDALMESHREHVPGADVAAMFAYLKVNFNDARPEPVVPPAFLEGGCTPF